jgi:glycerate 2-kinase
MRRLLAAPDKFRGTASAAEIATAFAEAARACGYRPTALPLADGGEGTLDALGGPNRVSRVHGPLGAWVDAPWRLIRRTAVLEVACASGLSLAGGAEGNDPIEASTEGVGELVNDAVAAGARRVVVAVGGAATTDGGLGALQAIDRSLLMDVEVVVASDVRTRFLSAANMFAAQKGATPDQVIELHSRLVDLAQRYKRDFGIDVTMAPGGGAAGGLAGGLYALGAQIVDGFGFVAASVGLDTHLKAADVVLTGEGSFDASSLEGKVVAGVLSRARNHGVPAGVIAGRIEVTPSAAASVSLVDLFGQAALDSPVACAERAAFTLLRSRIGARTQVGGT